MDTFTGTICSRHGLTVLETFSAGHVCNAVYKVKDGNNNLAVLKTGTDQKTVNEIIKNVRGYNTLHKIGLGRVPPEVLAHSIEDTKAFLLMEYCGEDFVTQTEKSANPELLYERLVNELRNIYFQSTVPSNDSMISVRSVLSKALECYRVYVADVLDPNRAVLPALLKAGEILTARRFEYSCFASWDFTPRNAFLSSRGLRYADCNEVVLGMPIVDLACFAGVVKDVNQLPFCEQGYALIEEFATHELPARFKISSREAGDLFSFGRFLQSLLGARFRVGTPAGEMFFQRACSFLEKILA